MGKESNNILIEAKDIHKVYRMGPHRLEVLKGVSLKVNKGELLSIMGASGAGKSTLLHIVGGLDRPSGGKISFEGRDVYSMPGAARAEMRALRFGFVFQSYHLLPELNVLENVILPSMSRFGSLGRVAEKERRGKELLDRVGLADRALHRPMELSGGEQQRTALARALINDPEVLLADEPTGNLDTTTGDQVLQYLFDLTRERGHTLLLVTHNEAVAGRCARQLHLEDGCLV